jgi:drug/metabolite transporter (DMT)-like permease
VAAWSRLAILGSALLFSTGGAAIKATPLSSWQVASLRSGIAALVLAAMMPAARRLCTRRSLLVGAGYTVTVTLFVLATKETTAANAVFLQSAAPFYMVLLAPLFLGEPVERRDLYFVAVVGVALGLLFAGAPMPLRSAAHPARGNVFAALGGFTWALTVVGFRWVSAVDAATASAAAVAVGNLLACLACLPAALPLRNVRPLDWLVVGYLGLFQVGLAYVLFTRAVPHVPALETVPLLLLEPALNPVWTWLVHREKPAFWSIAGGTVILAATVLRAWLDSTRAAGRSVAGQT